MRHIHLHSNVAGAPGIQLMTDLLITIPDFPTKHYAHLLPALERNLVTTADILTVDALDLAKRAQLPLLDVRRLKEHVLATLQRQLGLTSSFTPKFEGQYEGAIQFGELRRNGRDVIKPRGKVTTLDSRLDKALGGGIQTGYVTEITGERCVVLLLPLGNIRYQLISCSGAGKTQFLLGFLLSAQLPAPRGLERATCYISTEQSLPTTRLHQILDKNPQLSQATPSQPSQRRQPSLSQVLTLQTPDLESQEHILTYQLPIAITRHNVGLVVIDSVAANYRAERSDNTTSNAAALGARSAQLLRLGRLLQRLARDHDVAIVVSNQVADRFDYSPMPIPGSTPPSSNNTFNRQVPSTLTPKAQPQANPSSSPVPASASSLHSSPSVGMAPNPMPPPPQPPTPSANTTSVTPASQILTLDHQQRFFTGWGDSPPFPIIPSSSSSSSSAFTSHFPQQHQQQNLKTPSLGLVWTNQIACRIALIKELTYVIGHGQGHGGRGPAPTPTPHARRADADEYEESAEWTPRHWRRWMRVVFAPWVGGVREDDKGVEFEIWMGGVRSLPSAGR